MFSLMLIKRYSVIIFTIITVFVLNYLILNHEIEGVINKQTTTITEVVRKNHQQIKQSSDCPKSQDDNVLRDKILRLSIQESVINGKPFVHFLKDLNIENDQYLVEIATSGVSTVKNLQREFFMSILPTLQDKNSVIINNKFIANWIKIRKKDISTEKKVKFLVQELTLQNLDKVVQVIDHLPTDLQSRLQYWRKKVMDYIYVQEFLKMYLDIEID